MSRLVPAVLATALVLCVIPHAAAALCDGISTASGQTLTSVRIANGFARPNLVVSPPGDTSRLFVVEQGGKIRLIKDGVLLATPFLDASSLVRSPSNGGGNEQGMLGLAFHPNYATNGRLFVYHTDLSGNNLVVRYARATANPDTAEPASRRIIMTINHPTNTNHNGGMMAFGPDDGYLYIGTGDGGGSCDGPGNAQSGTSNLGKLLRIIPKLDASTPTYTIPADNPFVGAGGNNDEIWALGLRNPWRWSFDRANADLYIGDVGQGQWEEVDWRPGSDPGGNNYGWDKYEGTHCPNPSCGSADCNVSAYVGPVTEYDHSAGACSITGGFVYRGCRMPDLGGTYFYADYCANFIRSFVLASGVVTNPRDRTSEMAKGGSIGSITSFGEDARGEMFIVTQGGDIYKILPVLPAMEVSGSGASPLTLSRTGAWSWEDLQASSSQPITAYRVYRSSGNGSGTFDCIRTQAGTTWVGDPLSPLPGGTYAYLVTALNAGGEMTSPGTGSGGRARTLSAAACP